MTTGFQSIKDILETILVPITITFISLYWPTIQSKFKKIKFEAFILRELKEIDPIGAPIPNGKWTDHQKKVFIHQKMLEDPSLCHDLLLSLDADLIYRLNQLWGAFKREDSEKWIQYFRQLAAKFPKSTTEIEDNVISQWENIIAHYKNEKSK